MARAQKGQLGIGVSDHAGHAEVVVATARGEFVDRRNVVLIEGDLPAMPHHHEGQRLPIDEAVALVERVRSAAFTCARARLDELARALPSPVSGVALRRRPPLPATVAERIQNYRAMCVADWVMYRESLASAAEARGWRVLWYDERAVALEAARALKRASLDVALASAKVKAGTPWRAEHRMALAAAILAARA